MKDRITISISAATIFMVVGVLLGLKFLYLIREILLLFFIVLVLVAALSPIVDKWSTKMPRAMAVVLLYFIIIVAFAGVVSLLLPPLVTQLVHLANQLPSYLGQIAPPDFSYDQIVEFSRTGLERIAQGLSSIGGSLLNTTVSVFGGIAAVFSVVVLTFYLVLARHGIETFIDSLLPIAHKENVAQITEKIGRKLGRWVNGQLLLMLIIGVLDFIGFMIISIWEPELRNFALILAVWAGLTEVIPYIGPWFGAVPAVVIGFVLSPWIGLLIFAFLMIIQQLEGQFLVPKIMSKAVGLSPVIVIFSLLIGGKLLGILGVLLAVPFAAVLSVVYSEWANLRRIWHGRTN